MYRRNYRGILDTTSELQRYTTLLPVNYKIMANIPIAKM